VEGKALFPVLKGEKKVVREVYVTWVYAGGYQTGYAYGEKGGLKIN